MKRFSAFKTLRLFVLLTLQVWGGSTLTASELVATGFFVSNNSFISNYTVYHDTHPARIQDFIEAKNPGARDYSQSLSEEILGVSNCLAIDPIYLTALVYKESTFRPRAVSPTGAAGLTQITGAAINELRDQLGARGPGYSRASNTRYLTATLSQCMGKNYFEEFLNVLSKSDNAVKRAIKEKREWGLMMGAAVLKVYLAQAQDRSGFRGIEQVYLLALEQYNGDTNKASYARHIARLVAEFNQDF